MHLQEGRLWLEAAVATPLVSQTPERGWTLATLGHIAWKQGDVVAARSSIDDAEAAAHALGDDALLAEACHSRGALEYMAGNLTTARIAYEKGVALCREAEDTEKLAIMTHDLGLVALLANDLPTAHDHLEESLRLIRQDGLDRLEPGFLGSLGHLELHEGRIDRANDLLREGLSLAVARGVAGPWNADDLYVLAAVTALRGDATGACVLLGTSDAAVDRVGAAREPLHERVRSRALREAELRIGPHAADRACARGRTLDIVEAIEYALSLD
jgi:tetratricopeptide (TPR) repeat protein